MLAALSGITRLILDIAYFVNNESIKNRKIAAII